MKRRALVLISLVALAGLPAAVARADGDPGSDVLVYQPLFLASDAGVSVPEQVKLGALLRASAKSGFPIRVAIIASPADLGAVTSLWRKPRAYARFLGLELSQAYRGRLLVVMPNGFGFNWPGHSPAAAYRRLGRVSIGSSGDGQASAAGLALRSLAQASGIKLAGPSSPTPGAPRSPSSSPAHAARGSGADTVAAAIAAALVAAGGLALLLRRLHRRGALRLRLPPNRGTLLAGAGALAGLTAIVVLVSIGSGGNGESSALAANPNLDPGTPLSRPAPGFTLTDQFGQRVSLSSYRGKVVILAFNDSECATICPLTTSAMLDAKAMLGAAGGRVQLLGIDANPKATALEDVLSYSQLHGMLHSWHFLTGSLSQLEHVWKEYGVQAAAERGQIEHTPALFMIDPRGRLARLYVTQQSYAAVPQLGQLLAQEASQLLPGHPTVHSDLSYTKVAGVTPRTTITVPRVDGGDTKLGPGRPRLLTFFASWDRQITGLGAGLAALDRYNSLARRSGLPAVEGVDEGSVEPRGGLSNFFASLPYVLDYPVAIDRTGRIADGYEVEGLPWLVLVTASGRIAWYYSVGALGWPTTDQLVARVKEALARASAPPVNISAALRGSPPALAALHHQANRVLGSEPQLAARIRSLHGYPIVVNAWASWCTPCRSEFGLFASASARYGRQVAFLGADTDDSTGDALGFLAQHPVSYPSYGASTSNMSGVAPGGLQGLPTTIFIARSGKVSYVHTGQYDSQGTLDGDIERYALRG
jgi:cytochrome oxidase Cu insertion factor (SCO1/SenC/PrrC family)/thiol-disulfide isomerase/thioredoxin